MAGFGDYANRIGTAFNRGAEAVLEPYNRPGPEARVSPFEAGTVTPGAIGLKSLASLIYGVRSGANARATQQRLDSETQLRNLTMQHLAAETSAANALTQTRLNPKPKAAAAGSRLQMSQAGAAKLGLQWDPDTGTVDAPSARFAAMQDWRGTTHHDLQQWRGDNATRMGRNQASLIASRNLTNLTKAEQTQANIDAQEALKNIDAQVGVLSKPYDATDATGRALVGPAAQMLRLPYMFYQPDLSKPKQIARDAAGNPLYDTSKLAQYATNAKKAAIAEALAKVQAKNAALRALWTQMQSAANSELPPGYGGAGPDDTGESGPDYAPIDPENGDPLFEGLKVLARRYGIDLGASPADTSGQDIPAE